MIIFILKELFVLCIIWAKCYTHNETIRGQKNDIKIEFPLGILNCNEHPGTFDLKISLESDKRKEINNYTPLLIIHVINTAKVINSTLNHCS